MNEKLDLSLIRERAEALCDLENITVAEYAKRYNSYIKVAGVEAVLALLSRLEQAEQQVARVRAMAEQICKDCDGSGEVWGVDFDGSRKYSAYLNCLTCHGTGSIYRTGPYRRADGTWSDRVDRSKRIWSTYFAMKNKGRWHVYKGFKDIFTGYEWRVYSDRGFLRYFPTHAEAIAYADRMARTNQGETND